MRRAEQAKRFAALDAALAGNRRPRVEFGSPCDGSDFEAQGGARANESDLNRISPTMRPERSNPDRTASIRGEASSVDAEPGEGPKVQCSDQPVQFGASPAGEAEFGPESLADSIPRGVQSEPQPASTPKFSKLDALLAGIAAERRVPPAQQHIPEQSGTEPDVPQCSEGDRLAVLQGRHLGGGHGLEGHSGLS